MPYIKQANRTYFEEWQDKVDHMAISTPGELNYLITQLLNQFHITHTKNYQTMNDVVGALECCKNEYLRRIVGKYEDGKIAENGDAYNEETLR